MTLNSPPKLRLSMLLWCAGMLGVVAITVMVFPGLLAILPEMVGREAPSIPMWAVYLASLIQSGVLLALAVWLGSALAPKVGLSSPVFEAIAMGRGALAVLRRQLFPGVISGILGGALLFAFGVLAPPELRAAQGRLDAPLLARVLYGGVTEEILLRWGVMTFLVWLPWRLWQSRDLAPRAGYVWLAIVISSVAFGLGHLPAASLLIGELTRLTIVWVVGANALFGLLFGYLYWRRGLEAAMIAHAVTHVAGFVFTVIATSIPNSAG